MAPMPTQQPPEPPPLPPSPPVVVNVPPDPPATVVVNPPPEAHDWANWWYENAATMGSAFVALLAAAAAVYIVSRQIASANKAAAAQIRANAHQVRRQIEADRKLHRRQERVAIATEAQELLNSMLMPRGEDVAKALAAQEDDELLTEVEQAERSFRINSLLTRLDLLGMAESKKAIEEFRDALDDWIRLPVSRVIDGVFVKYNEAVAVLKRTIDES